MINRWKKINSRIVYKNPWFRVREDAVVRPDGKKGVYGVVERPNVNFIIALINDNKVLFIEEYRYPTKQIILQLPAGTTNKSENDLKAAKRELYEETGYHARKWKKIGFFFIAPGHESIVANVFLATNCEKSGIKKIAMTDELITNVRIAPLSQVKRMIAMDKIKCGITLASLNLFFQK